jgi:two-component system phosphate regulon response regulator PhoB
VQQSDNQKVEVPQLVRFISGLVDTSHPESDAKSEPDRLNVSGLMIDRKRHQAVVEGRGLDLTLTEFRIIWTLSLNAGVVVTRKQLADSCCGHAGNIQERTIDAHIRAIRHKLKDRSDLIETVRGVGYRFTDNGRPTVPKQAEPSESLNTE